MTTILLVLGVRLLALIRRLPRVRSKVVSKTILDDAAKSDYSEFEADFDVLRDELEGRFAQYDETALNEQNRYRRQNVIVILGAARLTGLGGLQAVIPGQQWPTAVLLFLGILLVASSRFADEGKALQSYLVARVRAERLRALFFAYLSHTGRYADDNRRLALREAIRAVDRGKEIE